MTHGVHSRISSLRRLLRNLIVVAGVSRLVLIALGLAALCLMSDWTFELSAGWRLALALGSLAGAAAAAHWFIVRPMRVAMPDDQLALLFERRFPELHDILISAIQLPRSPGGASPDLIAAVTQSAEAASTSIEPAHVPKLRKLSWVAVAAVTSVLAAAAFCVASPSSARIFLARFLDPFGPAEWPRSTHLVLEVAGSTAAEVSVPKGELVAVKVTAVNALKSPMWRPPQTVWLDYEHKSGDKDSRPMRRTEGQTYEVYFNDVLEDLTLQARSGNVRTAAVRVRVVDLPQADEVWLSLEYPKYTGQASERLSRSTTEVRALAATKLTVEIRSNRELKPGGAAITVDPAGTVPMRPSDGKGTPGATHHGEFGLAKDMKWFRIDLTDLSGLTAKQPRTFQLQVLEDRPPTVKIPKPGSELRCTPYALVPLQVTVNDDLAIRSAWLHYALGPQEKPQQTPFDPIPANTKEIKLDRRWDISELGVKAGQTVSYRAEADDFRDVFPPGSAQTRQVGQSEEYFLRIVSAADLASELDGRLFALRAELKKDKARQEEDWRKTGELLTKASAGSPMTNDDRSMAADAENIQRELARSIGRIADEIAKVRERMEDNRIGSFADRRRLDETRTALQDIANAEMPNAAEFIKNARRDLAGREGRDSLQSASTIQTRVITRLEQVIAGMSHNEDIENLVRAARELLRKQQSIRTGTAEFARRPDTWGAAPNDLKSPDLAALNLIVRNQKGAHDDMRNLEQDMLNVYERLKDTETRRSELVRQAQAQASRDQIRPMMEEAAAALAANQTGVAGDRQDTAIKGLERLLEILESAREEPGSGEALSQLVNDVRSALQDVQRLRKQQEGHANDATEINRNAAQAARLMQIRRELQRLREEQQKANAGAADPARLKDLAEKEAALAKEAAEIAENLDKEAKDAADRKAPQAGDIKQAANAVAEAESSMNAAKNSMQQSDSPKAGQAGKSASDKLAEADQALAKAIDTLENKRLTDTKDAAVKQGETEKEAEKTARRLKELSKENENASKEASDGLNKAGDKVGEAGKTMQGAQASLDRKDSVQGEADAKKARDQLVEAQSLLEKLRDELEQKQKEQKLLDLIVELQPMLEKQIQINDETLRIDAATAQQIPPEPSRPDKVRLGQLAGDESRIASKAEELLRKVEGEDAPVFVWGLGKLVKDTGEIKDRLTAFATDSYTQDIEKDAADTLKMLIDALKQEQAKMREDEAGGGGGEGGGGKPMLVPPSAQLKLLKARELEIHTNTKRIELKRLLQPDKPPAELDQKRMRRLAAEQGELADLTAKLAESLEKEVREQQRKQGEMK